LASLSHTVTRRDTVDEAGIGSDRVVDVGPSHRRLSDEVVTLLVAELAQDCEPLGTYRCCFSGHAGGSCCASCSVSRRASRCASVAVFTSLSGASSKVIRVLSASGDARKDLIEVALGGHLRTG